jgi:hypothetical protein
MVRSQFELAWALARAESPGLKRADRNLIYAEIGSGETYSAIVRLLINAVRRGLPLPTDVVSDARRWVSGYLGTPDEPRLRRLLEDVQSCPGLPR